MIGRIHVNRQGARSRTHHYDASCYCKRCGMSAHDVWALQRYRCLERAPLFEGRPVTLGLRISFRIPTLAELFPI
jgi:hypothetical protein